MNMMTPHSTRYDKIINVYCGSNVENIIKNIIENLNSKQYMEELAQNIEKTIDKLRGALEVLDSRTITCISARVLYFDGKTKWYLVNVWRGGARANY